MVEGEIAEMDQQGKHIVLAPESHHIILEFVGVDAAASAAEHFYNIVFQTIKIHADIFFQGFVRLRACPVIVDPVSAQGVHDGLRVVYVKMVVELVSIIPLPDSGIIRVVLLTEILHFRLRKADVLLQRFGIDHRKFIKVVERRLRAVFFDRQDPGQISQREKFFRGGVLEQTAQEFEI